MGCTVIWHGFQRRFRERLVDEHRQFNVRVYAIIRDSTRRLLVVDEVRMGMCMTKFPGGGMRWGEGVVDCLFRECREEIGVVPASYTHFYTTEFFQPSAFNSSDQILSIYYLVELPASCLLLSSAHDPVSVEAGLVLRWIDSSDLRIDSLTLPIDQHVASMLIGQHS